MAAPGARRAGGVRGITFAPGTRLEAKDYMANWYPARIIDIDEAKQQALIHFERWNKRFDEWIDYTSDRVRPLVPRTDPAERIASCKDSKAQVGHVVAGRWHDRKFYPATVVDKKTQGAHVLFDLQFEDNDRSVLKGVPAHSILTGRKGRTAVGGTRDCIPPSLLPPTPKKGAKASPRQADTSKAGKHRKTAKGAAADHLSTPSRRAATMVLKRPSTSKYAKRVSADEGAYSPASSKRRTAARKLEPEEPRLAGPQCVSVPVTQLPAPLKAVDAPPVLDHNEFKCTVEACGRAFRKEMLLQSHLKHYHGVGGGGGGGSTTSTPNSRREKDKAKRKRPGTPSAGTPKTTKARGVAPSSTAGTPAPTTHSKRRRKAKPPKSSAQKEEESRTRCVCGHDEESAFMIQCERCLCWQHGACVGVNQKRLPASYLCFACVHASSELADATHPPVDSMTVLQLLDETGNQLVEDMDGIAKVAHGQGIQISDAEKHSATLSLSTVEAIRIQQDALESQLNQLVANLDRAEALWGELDELGGEDPPAVRDDARDLFETYDRRRHKQPVSRVLI